MNVNLVTAFGTTKGVNAWCRDRRCRVSAQTLKKRLAAGWDPEQALATPADQGAPAASVTAFGESKTIRAWASDPRCAVSAVALAGRLTGGWDPEQAITAPARTRRPPRSQVAASAFVLRPHQQQAVQAAVDELAHAQRALIVAACGTGKTVIGAEISRRIAPDGRVLIVLPTLELLAQTATAYARHLGPGVGRLGAVCSDAGATADAATMHAALEAAHVGTFTDPAEIARLAAAPGRLTLLCTYQSLSKILEACTGLWDLLVIDEAHRSAGRAERAWNAVHNDIPAHRRLYMTATPRIMGESDYDAVSMDDPAVFGREVYRLGFGDAIAEGLLADYRVVVSVITDQQVHRHIYDTGAVIDLHGRPVPAAMLAAQISLLKAARTHNLRRVLSFHQRVLSAAAFATTLDHACAALPDQQRPVALRAAWVSGEMGLAERRAALALLDDNAHTTVISNARVLGEGVDVPELDAVMFTDPRQSPTDVVQAVGRALRRGRRARKIATIIIPLMIAQEEADAAALDGSAFDVVWRTIRALRAHDERLADWLDAKRIAVTFEDEHTPTRIHELPAWLSLVGDPLPAGFAEAVTTRIVEASSSSWWASLGRLAAFKKRTGHLRPSRAENPAEWNFLNNARHHHSRGRLAPDRARALERLGVVLDQAEERNKELVENAERYRALHGDLRVPQTYKDPDTGYPLGSRINVLRGYPSRFPQSVHERVNTLGMIWSVPDEQFDELLTHATAHTKTAGKIGKPDKALRCACCGSYTLGARLVGKRNLHARGKLPEIQETALTALGIELGAVSRTDRRERAFRSGVAACKAWLVANPNPDGTPRATLDVPVNHIAPDGHRTGDFIAHMRALHTGIRRDRKGQTIELPERWRTELDELGMIWSTTDGRRDTTAEEIARLKALPDGRARSPEHRALTAAIAELVEADVTASSIADALGIKRPTLSLRLKRHRERTEAPADAPQSAPPPEPPILPQPTLLTAPERATPTRPDLVPLFQPPPPQPASSGARA